MEYQWCSFFQVGLLGWYIVWMQVFFWVNYVLNRKGFIKLIILNINDFSSTANLYLNSTLRCTLLSVVLVQVLVFYFLRTGNQKIIIKKADLIILQVVVIHKIKVDFHIDPCNVWNAVGFQDPAILQSNIYLFSIPSIAKPFVLVNK